MFNLAEMTISDHISAETISCGKKEAGGRETLWLESVLKQKCHRFDVWNIQLVVALKVSFTRY